MSAADTPSPPAAPDPERTGGRPGRPYVPVLDVLRIAACIGVVGIHVVADAVTAGSLPFRLVSMAFVVTVPVFFLLAGSLNLAPRAMRAGPPPSGGAGPAGSSPRSSWGRRSTSSWCTGASRGRRCRSTTSASPC